MEFVTDKEIDDWIIQHTKYCKSKAFDGAQFKFEFIPTGIVEVQEVTCGICKKKKLVYVD